MRTRERVAIGDLTVRERPVFLDETGRRARAVGIGGRMLALLTAAWVAALVLGASAPLSLPSLNGQLSAAHASGAARAHRHASVPRHSLPVRRDIDIDVEARAGGHT